MDPTTVVCVFGIVHGVELGASEVPAVEPYEDCFGLGGVSMKEGVKCLDETDGKGGFPGCGDACDGDQEATGVRDAAMYLSRSFFLSKFSGRLHLHVELVDDELGAVDEDVVHDDGRDEHLGNTRV